MNNFYYELGRYCGDAGKVERGYYTAQLFDSFTHEPVALVSADFRTMPTVIAVETSEHCFHVKVLWFKLSVVR